MWPLTFLQYLSIISEGKYCCHDNHSTNQMSKYNQALHSHPACTCQSCVHDLPARLLRFKHCIIVLVNMAYMPGVGGGGGGSLPLEAVPDAQEEDKTAENGCVFRGGCGMHGSRKQCQNHEKMGGKRSKSLCSRVLVVSRNYTWKGKVS